MLQQLTLIHTWNDLTTTLESQFGPSVLDFPTHEFFKLSQLGIVS